jgi:hypothetical protein
MIVPFSIVSESLGMVMSIGMSGIAFSQNASGCVGHTANGFAYFAGVRQHFLFEVPRVWRWNIVAVHTMHMIIKVIKAQTMNLSCNL